VLDSWRNLFATIYTMDVQAIYARNNALNINPDIGGRADISITTHGSDFYYAICAVMGTVALTVMGLSFLKPQTDRIFFYITAALNATACIAYFSMGSNLGQVPITAEFQRNDPVVRGVTREIFYARYIDWFVTTPLLLMDLLLTAGMPWPSILWTIFLDEVMIITGLLGALTRTRYKFGKSR
jgi:bacteriorhodopsin